MWQGRTEAFPSLLLDFDGGDGGRAFLGFPPTTWQWQWQRGVPDSCASVAVVGEVGTIDTKTYYTLDFAHAHT